MVKIMAREISATVIKYVNIAQVKICHNL